MKHTIRLVSEIHRSNALAVVKNAPKGCVVEVRNETRSEYQNRKLWAMLTDISRQVPWDGDYRTPEQWKDLLSAAFHHAEVVQGLDGKPVALGLSTSRMGKQEFAEFVESIYAWGAENDVIWSEPALEFYATLMEAS